MSVPVGKTAQCPHCGWTYVTGSSNPNCPSCGKDLTPADVSEKQTYEVVKTGIYHGCHWWDVKLDHQPDTHETAAIAQALDGGWLFGSRCEPQGKGVYRIVGYID